MNMPMATAILDYSQAARPGRMNAQHAWSRGAILGAPGQCAYLLGAAGAPRMLPTALDTNQMGRGPKRGNNQNAQPTTTQDKTQGAITEPIPTKDCVQETNASQLATAETPPW